MLINTIYNEDCFITLKEHIDNNSIDCILTSPPYNMTKRKGGISDTGRYDIYNDWKSEEEYIEFSVSLFKELDFCIKENGVILYNLSFSKENPILPTLVVSEIHRQTEWTLVDKIVWEKSSAIPSPADRLHHTRKCEMIYVFARKSEKETFNRYPGISKVGSNGQTYYKTYNNIIKAANNDEPTKELNQATYSSELCIKLIEMYTKEEDLVYDPFIGTGTTAKACVLTQRNYIGSELSSKQCEYSKQRIEKLKKI